MLKASSMRPPESLLGLVIGLATGELLLISLRIPLFRLA